MTGQYITHSSASLAGEHSSWLATGNAALLIVAIGAAAAITLVALVPREHRVEAIRATAELLAALLPWPARRNRGQHDE